MAIGRTNAGSGGGLNKSILIVSAPTGATLTATLGDTVKTATEKTPGEYWLKNLDLGEWNLKLTLGEQSATAKYNIERFGVYRTSMAFFAATIKITYPEGSTCTCSKGDKIYNAPDTTGTWNCVVDSAGEWTVSITADGQEPKSQKVDITEDGQSVSVSISFEIVLYDSGDQCTPITGGWEVGDESSAFEVSFGSSSIVIDCAEYSSTGYINTKNNIDRGSLTTLCIVASLSEGERFRIGYGGSRADIPAGNKTTTLDISKLNNQKVKISHDSGTGSAGKLTVTKVYIR